MIRWACAIAALAVQAMALHVILILGDLWLGGILTAAAAAILILSWMAPRETIASADDAPASSAPDPRHDVFEADVVPLSRIVS